MLTVSNLAGHPSNPPDRHKDLLENHFDSGVHNGSGPCACGSGSAQQSGQSQRTTGGPAPGARKSTSTGQQKTEEDAARRRDDERRRRANDEAKQAAEQAAKRAHEETVQTAFREEDDRNQESLRWKISIGCAAIFALLLCVPIVSDAVEKPILSGQKFLYGPKDYTGESKQLSDDWRSYQNDKVQVAYTLLRREPVTGETSQWRPPFVSNQHTADNISRLAYQQLVACKEEERNRRAQDLSNTRLDVERYEKYISFARTKLADAAAKLADPSITGRDRAFAVSDQATQLKFLQESQTNLKYAQQHLEELQGNGASVQIVQQIPQAKSPAIPVKSLLENVDMNPIIRSDRGLTSKPGRFLRLNSLPSLGS